jgi:hypothetical protein
MATSDSNQKWKVAIVGTSFPRLLPRGRWIWVDGVFPTFPGWVGMALELNTVADALFPLVCHFGVCRIW